MPVMGLSSRDKGKGLQFLIWLDSTGEMTNVHISGFIVSRCYFKLIQDLRTLTFISTWLGLGIRG
jgi:hypothetical protein